MKRVHFRAFVILTIITLSAGELPFSYNLADKNGPSKWSGVCTSGKQQSPIVYDKVEAVKVEGTLVMTGAYNVKPIVVSVDNHGHGTTFTFKYKGSEVPKITGGPLGTDVYEFLSYHFHYPCEHGAKKFEDKCFLEVHFVHVNSKYSSFDVAASMADGLAVIAVMYTPTINNLLPSLPYVDMLEKVYEYNKEYVETKNTFSYAQALGFTKIPNFVSYNGSLTTPECAESVIWIVVDKLFPMRFNDLAKFYFIRDDKGQFIANMNRPYQNLNGRIIRAYNQKLKRIISRK